MTTRLTAPLASHVSYTKEVLARAHRDFAKNPSATHWDALTRAAFTYQQIEWASRSPSIDREKLAYDLDCNPIGHWQDAICRATVGTGVLDSLRDFATN